MCASEIGSQLDTGANRSEVLLAVARPTIFRDNAFRAAELPVDATGRDLAKREQVVTMAVDAGLPVPPGAGRALPMPGAADPDVVREATQRLRDPERRLVEELFWFWPQLPGESRSDAALGALARGDPDAAANVWLRQELNHGEADVAMHNLAVLAHVRALDAEVAANPLVSQEARKQRDLCWQQAFKRWRLLIEHDGFWDRLTARIRALDDPRLTTGTARRIRAALPEALLSINAELAVGAVQRGDNEEGSRHVRIMRQSGFQQRVVEEALRRAAEPVRDEIKRLCVECEAEADADPAHANGAATRLLAQGKARLAGLDILLAEGDTARAATHDEVAQRILACQIPYANRTEDWVTSLALLEEALPIAASEAVRGRLQENIETVRRNLDFQKEHETCFFCGQRRKVDAAAPEVKMYGDVTTTLTLQGRRIQWRNADVKVPRCEQCKTAHSRVNNYLLAGLLLGVVAGLASCIPVQSGGETFGALALFVALGFVGALAGWGAGIWRFNRGIKREGAKTEAPAVKRLLAEGWQIGDKPPEANQS